MIRPGRLVAAATGGKGGQPMEIPGVGTYVPFVDPEGNRVSLPQPLPRRRSART
jgi:predicted enzyme related to lactoylglutathione lyase